MYAPQLRNTCLVHNQRPMSTQVPGKEAQRLTHAPGGETSQPEPWLSQLHPSKLRLLCSLLDSQEKGSGKFLVSKWLGTAGSLCEVRCLTCQGNGSRRSPGNPLGDLKPKDQVYLHQSLVSLPREGYYLVSEVHNNESGVRHAWLLEVLAAGVPVIQLLRPVLVSAFRDL